MITPKQPTVAYKEPLREQDIQETLEKILRPMVPLTLISPIAFYFIGREAKKREWSKAKKYGITTAAAVALPIPDPFTNHLIIGPHPIKSLPLFAILLFAYSLGDGS